MKRIFSLILFTAVSISALASGNDPFVRYPALNSDGSQIAFTFQGDIWTVPVNGGNAVRLTIHEAYDAAPVFSPDDKYIAFSSDRFGNDDIFTIPVKGGMPKRLTYYSSGDYVYDWNGGEILFSTRREFRQLERTFETYSISPEGGTPKRILNAMGDMAVKSPNGKFIAFVMGECRIEREQYTGPANRDIWLYEIAADKFSQLTDFNGQDYMPQWGSSNELYYVSAKPGRYNVFKIALDDSGNKTGETQLTDFDEDGVHYLKVSRDGNKIVMLRTTSMYTMNNDGSDVKQINVKIGADYRFDPIEHKTMTDGISDYAISPNGKLAAFSTHGEVFITQTDKEKSRSIDLSNHPFRDQYVQWLSDSTLIFTSDRDGQYDIYMALSADEDQPDIFKSLKHKIVRITDTPEDESWPVISPDGKKIAYEIGRGKLVVADIDAEGKLSNSVTLLDGWSIPEGVTWSPDSKWLAYSLEDLNFNSEIYIHSADNSKKPVNVSMHPRGDSSPFWSKDGSKLGFLSARNNQNNDVWFVWLKKADWQKSKLDWEEDDGSDKADKKDKKKDDKDDKKKDEVEPIQIDFDGIHERLVQVTSMSGDEGNIIISNDGETFYFTANNPPNKGRDLFSVKWDGDKLETVTNGGANPYSLQLDKDGKNIYHLKSGGRLAKITLSGNKSESISFSAKMDINYVEELDQIFEEAWRTLNEGFYDPKFHGKDWEVLREKYKPLCLSASTKTDFQYMFNNMLGELNASHMGLYGSDRAETQRERTGLLGIEIDPEVDGILVKRVIPESPADREASKLYAGDEILSINGKNVEDENFYSLLTNTADEKIVLNVKGKEGEREVVIRPISSYGNLVYDEWVKQRRAMVDKLSNGRLGYLHIQAMGWDSFERFERELTAAGLGKEGIVIDVRYNGGGWTTDYLMAILNVKQHAYTVPRGATNDLQKNHLKFREDYPYAERLPFYPWTKSSIALCNASSYSNAEIFSHAYKTLGIGTLVGEPTFGAVISTGGKGLIDGSFVRLPFRAWYVKATDENMEWGPAVPDVIVRMSPDSKAKNKDEQLKKAVEVLLKQIDEKK